MLLPSFEQKGATVPVALNRLVSISIGRQPSSPFVLRENKKKSQLKIIFEKI